MKVSAFTYVRNGFTYAYPFIQSIKSLLPIVDEYIVVIGDSTDGTREAVVALNSSKIKIVDTIWDEQLRTGGKIFALQANIGMDNAAKDADWLFHLQADEVLHEEDLEGLQKAMQNNLERKEVEGFLLRFINFYGDYNHYCPTRRFHQREIRIVRNDPGIRSYKDSMGFRKFVNPDGTEKGEKLKAKQVEATVYHYSWVRPPKKLKAKQLEFTKRYHQTDEYVQDYEQRHKEEYSYREYDFLKIFNHSHPAVMQEIIASQDWIFKYDPANNNMTFKEKLMKLLEEITGKQFFIYKNYKVIK
jgi:glycosyltransferase involved in cell wall biosynthesis